MHRLTIAILLAARAAAAEPAWQTPGADEAGAARRLSAAGRCDEALEPFDRAIEWRSGDATLRRDRGACHDTLGHAAPAIDDYRAYLAMAPDASDAESIQHRLDELRAEHDRQEALRKPTSPPSPSAAPESGVGDATTRWPSSQGVVGWLVGLHVGARDWSSKGFSKPTTSVGASIDYALLPHWELDGRLSYVSTNVDKTSGFGGSLGGAFRMTPFGSNAYELSMGASLGYETQKNSFGVSRDYLFVRANPTFRWLPAERIALDLGPEIFMGMMGATSDGDLYSQPTSSAFTAGYGGRLELLWIIGS